MRVVPPNIFQEMRKARLNDDEDNENDERANDSK